MKHEKEVKYGAEDGCICGHPEYLHWGNALGHCKACSCWGFRRPVIRSLSKIDKPQ